MTLEFSQQIFEKFSNIKFHENPSSGSRVVPWAKTDGQTWRSWVPFRNFADAHKNCNCFLLRRDYRSNARLCLTKSQYSKHHVATCSNTQWFLVNDQPDAQILFYILISNYNSLHVSSTSCSSSGETYCINTASGNNHSMLVWLLSEAILIQFVSPDDEHDVLETWREL